MEIDEKKIKKAKQDILTMTTLANSGHPGGSISSLEILFSCYISANWQRSENRERVIVSNGHIAPGVYSVLGHLGVIPIEDAVSFFRYAGSPYEGHIENIIPGIPWTTGNLGQGLSAACGFALDAFLRKSKENVYCIMGDAEQAKGQIAEARKFAKKFALNNLIAVIDRNNIQISGTTKEIMDVDIEKNYTADGWKVLNIKGHDLEEIFKAFKIAKEDADFPYCIIANTIMGNGISFMENKPDYHGKPLSEEEYNKACSELGFEPELEKYRKIRIQGKKFTEKKEDMRKREFIFPIKAFTENNSDLRGKWGEYLDSAAALNNNIVVFDCDLAGSVKTDKFAKAHKERFFQCGVMEHNVTTVSGVLSKNISLNVFWADFGMFNVAEVYNQLRLNDINGTNLNIISTHLGLDVGEDGKTHQSIDYVGLLKNIFGFRVFLPADFNQLLHIMDNVFSEYGNKFVGMGRSKISPIITESGDIYYSENYDYHYGKVDELRKGDDIWIFTTGQIANNAVLASDQLKKEGINIGCFHFSTPLKFDTDVFINKTVPKNIILLEDHNPLSGLGSAIEKNIFKGTEIIKIGVENYCCSGNSGSLYKKNKMDTESIAERIRKIVL